MPRRVRQSMACRRPTAWVIRNPLMMHTMKKSRINPSGYASGQACHLDSSGEVFVRDVVRQYSVSCDQKLLYGDKARGLAPLS